jgi:hypothetical protein
VKVRLLAPHIIRDEQLEKGAEVEIPSTGVTPLMEGLDPEAIAAVAAARLKVWGRHPGTPYGLPPQGPPLDSPPIPRPLEENQPVFHYVGRKEYIS